MNSLVNGTHFQKEVVEFQMTQKLVEMCLAMERLEKDGGKDF